MDHREFGRTGVSISERGFGAWAIGGSSYGPVPESAAHAALARAEEAGCNVVDTAAVYGRSEEVIGRFLKGRRDRWFVASKYSGQPEGMTALIEAQLERLDTTWIDFYQIHWVPRGDQAQLFEELQHLKEAGKIRFAGVSLYSAGDIDDIVSRPDMDGFQIAVSLLNPRPFVERLAQIEAWGGAVFVRSALESGFLTGKYGADSTFGPDDERGSMSEAKRARILAGVAKFAALTTERQSLADLAIGYVLGFPQVTSVLLGTKNGDQASRNFADRPALRLDAAMRERIHAVQEELGLLRDGWHTRLRMELGSAMRRFRGMVRR